jgi:hypothetical protein
MSTFEVTSGKLCISDPCYVKGTWCGLYDLPAANGIWEVDVHVIDAGDWGKRVASIIAKAKGQTEVRSKKQKGFELGVDSGQMSIFDGATYPDSEEDTGDYDDLKSFYGKCCAASSSNKRFGIVDKRGIVTTSGYGDGGYPCYLSYNDKGEVIGVIVTFIDDDEESDDER